MPALAELPQPPSPLSCLPGERPRVDAAGNGCFAVVHRDSVPDAVRTVRERPVDAVLVSVHRCRPSRSRRWATWCGSSPAFPRWRWCRSTIRAPPRCCSGSARPGVRQVVDVTSPAGWNRLRQVVGQPATRAVARIQAPILTALGRRTARCPPLSGSVDPPGARHPDGHRPGGAALRPAQHPDVTVCPGGSSLAQELPGGGPAAPCRVPVPGGGTLGRRRGLSAGVLLTPELRAASPGHAGNHRGRVPPPLSRSRSRRSASWS